MGFPLPPYDESFSCAFTSVLSRLSPSQQIQLAGNGYHLHENLIFQLFVLSNVARREEPCVPPPMRLDFSSDDEM